MSKRAFNRRYNVTLPNKIIYVYTEGVKTETNYFNSIKSELRLNSIKIIVTGLGDHTRSLIERVISSKENAQSYSEENEWWAVFDKDDHDDFNKSIDMGRAHEIEIAYSNECFELWFILHFEFLDTSIGRNNIFKKLSVLLNRKYTKNTDVYSLIKEKEAFAIKNAKKLELKHDEEGNNSAIKRVPSTTVYKLVERLRMLKK